MTRLSLLRRLTSFLSPASAGDHHRARPAATRLSVERLEARDVPAFLAPVQYSMSNMASGSVVTADLNGDGLSDIAVHRDSGEDSISVRLNNGDGTFGAVHNFYGGFYWGSGQTLATGDFNGDGKTDLAAGHYNGVNVLLGDGAGSFATPIEYLFPDSETATALTTADLNGDGNLDLIAGTQNWYGDPSLGQSLAVFMGNGDGTFAAPAFYALPYDNDIYTYPTSIQVGDLNEDGNPDVVASRESNTLDVLFGNGDGTLGSVSLVPTDSSQIWSISVALGDVNGDGHLDLVANDTWGVSVKVLTGDGTGAFAPSVSYTVGELPMAVRLGDVNADGRLDIVTANSDGNNASVLLGVSGGSFALVRNFAAIDGPYSFALGNFDGNGYPDLVVGSQEGQGIATIRNDGSWSLIGTPTLSISDVSKAEGAKGSTYFTFTVTLAFSLDVAVTVNYATANGTATTANADYVAKSGTITFAPGETSKTITIEVKGDRKKEANETFFVRLSAGVNALIADNEGVGTIWNDD